MAPKGRSVSVSSMMTQHPAHPGARGHLGATFALLLSAAALGCAAQSRGLSLRDDPRAAPPVTPIRVPAGEATDVDTAAAAPETWAVDTTPPDTPAGHTIDVRNASTLYDFRVTTLGECSAGRLPEMCEAPAKLVIIRKATDQEVQRIDLEQVDLVAGDGGKVLVNSAKLYDAQGTFQVGDFNFDGHEDFAVEDSQNGSYGGPTFEVFLYDARVGQFVEANELSELTHANLGFFQIDRKRRRIIVHAKSGCCDHTTEEYSFIRGSLVLMQSLEERYMPGDDEQVEITRGNREGPNKWCTVTTQRPLRADER
jgi:hypothetical protein